MLIRFGLQGPSAPGEKAKPTWFRTPTAKSLTNHASTPNQRASSMLCCVTRPPAAANTPGIRTRSLDLISEHRVVESASGSCVLQGCLSCM